jgi:hypothetical protein
MTRERHAVVTADAHHRHMPGGPWHDSPGRAGALILRVWLEDRGDSKLRIRMVGRLDLNSDTHDTAAATVEEALAYVRDWLERFADSG